MMLSIVMIFGLLATIALGVVATLLIGKAASKGGGTAILSTIILIGSGGLGLLILLASTWYVSSRSEPVVAYSETHQIGHAYPDDDEEIAIEEDHADILQKIRDAQTAIEAELEADPENERSLAMKAKLEDELKALEDEQAKQEAALADQPDWLRDVNRDSIFTRQTIDSRPLNLPSTVVVSSGRWVTPEEARQDAEQMAWEIVAAEFARNNPTRIDLPALPLSAEQAEKYVVASYEESLDHQFLDSINSNMHRTHLLIRTPTETVASLVPVYRQVIIERRILLAGIGLVSLMILSGGVGIAFSRNAQL